MARLRERRRFEFTEGKSNKFWAIWREARKVTTHWGRIGTFGQERSREHESLHAARRAERKMIQAKVSKGYVEVTHLGNSRDELDIPQKNAKPPRKNPEVDFIKRLHQKVQDKWGD